MLAFLDLETEGLSPAKHRVLEVACIVTDDALTEVARFHRVCRTPTQFYELDEFIRDMHTKNGLWKETQIPPSRTRTVTGDEYTGAWGIEFVDGALAEFLRDHAVKLGKDDKGRPTVDRPQLAGNSIHFDRGFMKVHMPNAEAELHYRMLDVSSINELMRRANKPVWEGRPRTAETAAHRAMPDAEESLRVCRYYAARFGNISGPETGTP